MTKSSASTPTAFSHADTPTADNWQSVYPDDLVRQLNALTSAFYAREAISFSTTRQSPWHGWDRAWNALTTEAPLFADMPLTVLDLGCGNLRFERFLVGKTSAALTVYALDNCPKLAGAGFDEHIGPASSSMARPINSANLVGADSVALDFRELDIVEALLEGAFAHQLPLGTCDIAVAFGLMHHLPGFYLRVHTLQGLLTALRPGGFAIISFWQFLNDARLAAKAEAAKAEGRARHNLPPFAPGDYLLGWQDSTDVFRFCHHTTDGEIDALLAEAATPAETVETPAAFREIARFSADGKTGDLNRYVVLERL